MTKRQHDIIDIVVVILIAIILALYFYGQAHAESAVIAIQRDREVLWCPDKYSAVDSFYGRIDTTATVDSIIIISDFGQRHAMITVIQMIDSICLRMFTPSLDTTLYAIRLYGTYQDLERYAKRPHYKYMRIMPATSWWGMEMR